MPASKNGRQNLIVFLHNNHFTSAEEVHVVKNGKKVAAIKVDCPDSIREIRLPRLKEVLSDQKVAIKYIPDGEYILVEPKK